MFRRLSQTTHSCSRTDAENKGAHPEEDSDSNFAPRNPISPITDEDVKNQMYGCEKRKNSEYGVEDRANAFDGPHGSCDYCLR